jgi:SAM-dependent methyltransferase
VEKTAAMRRRLLEWWTGTDRDSLSEVINPTRYEDPEWDALPRELETYSTDKWVFRHTGGEVHRKGYEWTQCIFGMQKLGLVQPHARAVGVGAGHEPVIFWLADRIDLVTATDLYGNDTWSKSGGKEAAADVLANPERYCPRPIARDKVVFQNADGTKLPFANAAFDFCWSLSSIEHFGGHEAAAAAMREMARVTKPGGVVCVATELLLSNLRHPEFFNRREFCHYLIDAADDLELVSRMRWKLPPAEYLNDPIRLPQDVRRLRRHVVLSYGPHRWTSVIAFLRKRHRQIQDSSGA